MPRAYARQDPICSMCDQPSKAKGLCSKHYMQRRRFGEPDDNRWARYRSDDLQHANRKYNEGDPCTIEGCSRPNRARGLCSTHYGRLLYDGDVHAEIPIRPHGQGWHINSDGYRVLGTGAGKLLEHRVVMERMVGRPLEACENVHHKNGQRADNRPENLELWVTRQPQGQRVEDLVAFVVDHYPNLVGQLLAARDG